MVFDDRLSAWSTDDDGKAQEYAKAFVSEDLREHAHMARSFDEDRAVSRLRTAKGVRDLLHLASSDPNLAFGSGEDNPWQLQASNGAVCLKTGEITSRTSADRVEGVLSVSYDPVAQCPEFDKFLARIQPLPEMRDYLQRILGHALIGQVVEHVIPVFFGPSGANGKSVLCGAVEAALGRYARQGSQSLAIAGRSDPHPQDVASLRGARVVFLSELRKGSRFDDAKLKRLSGGDVLCARYMHGNDFNFAPSHTLFMTTNNRPSADGADPAVWRRLRLVPFDVCIPESERDPNLPSKLKAEAAGILRWLVDGCLAYQNEGGLAAPQCVSDVTREYRADSNPLAEFLSQRTNAAHDATVGAKHLCEIYNAWRRDHELDPVSNVVFSDEMKARGIIKRRMYSGVFYVGVALI